MGKFNGKAILNVQTANSFAESLNIINIEKGRRKKRKKVPVRMVLNHLLLTILKQTWYSYMIFWLCSVSMQPWMDAF